MPSVTPRQPTESQSIPVHSREAVSSPAVSGSKFSPMKRAGLLGGQRFLKGQGFAAMRIAASQNPSSGAHARDLLAPRHDSGRIQVIDPQNAADTCDQAEPLYNSKS